jgi:hypothetical protein
MEALLVLYEMPYDARYPTVCLDEKPVVLHAEVRESLPPAPGQVERRTKQDYAECLRYLVEERYTDAECIYLVQDNLNMHTAGALYETFPPAQARTILDRLEFHFTPKHGS